MCILHIEPLYLILLLVGAEPFYETRQKSIWKKVNKIGLLLCLVQLTFTTIGYMKERDRSAATAHFSNNILRVTIMYKQIFTIVQPYVYLLAKLLHIRYMEKFHLKMARFDYLLRMGSKKYEWGFKEALQKIQEVSYRWNILATGSLILGEVVNIWIGVIYVRETTESAPEADLFYFYQVTVLNFVGSAFYIAIKLSEVKMRLELILELEKGIVKDIVEEELGKRGVFTVFPFVN